MHIVISRYTIFVTFWRGLTCLEHFGDGEAIGGQAVRGVELKEGAVKQANGQRRQEQVGDEEDE